jgi:hypothetical protein
MQGFIREEGHLTHDEKLAIDQVGVNTPFAASPAFVETVERQLEEYNALRILEGQLPVDLLPCTEAGRRALDASFESGAFRVFVPREAGASSPTPEAPPAPPGLGDTGAPPEPPPSTDPT